MTIELIKVQESAKSVLRQLMELYLYDFSQYDDANVNEHGHYGYTYLDQYWTEPNRTPFFIKVDDQLAGFVLVQKLPDCEPATMSMAEFFVMRKYRRGGVGKTAALHIFDAFRGRWDVRQIVANGPAKMFWERVISDYTDRQCEIQTVMVNGEEIQVISFDNSQLD